MYFDNAQFQFLMWTLLGGAMLALVVVVGYFGYRLSLLPPLTEEEAESTVHEFNDGIREGNRRVPLFVILVGITVLVWGIFYTIAIATGHIGGIYELPK